MASVAEFFKVNPITVSPAPAYQGSDFATAQDTYNRNVNPLVDAQNANYINQMLKLNQMPIVPTQTVQDIINSGKLVSASTGFNDPGELRGLTPDQYAQISNNQNPMQILNSGIDLADKVHGVSDFKRNMNPALAAANSAKLQAIHAGGSAGVQAQSNLEAGQSRIAQAEWEAEDRAKAKNIENQGHGLAQDLSRQQADKHHAATLGETIRGHNLGALETIAKLKEFDSNNGLLNGRYDLKTIEKAADRMKAGYAKSPNPLAAEMTDKLLMMDSGTWAEKQVQFPTKFWSGDPKVAVGSMNLAGKRVPYTGAVYLDKDEVVKIGAKEPGVYPVYKNLEGKDAIDPKGRDSLVGKYGLSVHSSKTKFTDSATKAQEILMNTIGMK